MWNQRTSLTSAELWPFRERDKPDKVGKWLIELKLQLPVAGSFTFHPRFSKKVHNLAWPVVFPPHGPGIRQTRSLNWTVRFVYVWLWKTGFFYDLKNITRTVDKGTCYVIFGIAYQRAFYWINFQIVLEPAKINAMIITLQQHCLCHRRVMFTDLISLFNRQMT